MLDPTSKEWKEYIGIEVTENDTFDLNRQVYKRIRDIKDLDRLDRDDILIEIESNVRGFNSPYEYANYVYDTDESMGYFINRVAELTKKYPNKLFVASDLLYNADDIKLENGKVVLVMM